ncbi:MAG: hypothetical protein P8168_01700 [Deltaproteobacteria bacterium]|jgi:hypothetical protein
MPICACGCNQPTKSAAFLPGHDRRLGKQLEEKVGGLLLLSSLVKVTQTYAQGHMSLDDLGRLIKLIYSQD